MLHRQLSIALMSLALLVACGEATTPSASVLAVTIPGGDLALTVGQSLVLSAEVTVTGGASRSVVWSSSTPTVASVSTSGRVDALAPGTTTITATSVADTTVSASVRVTVTLDGSMGAIAGTVTVGSEPTAAPTGLRSADGRSERRAETAAPFVAGEIIVGFAPGMAVRAAAPLTVAGTPLALAEAIPDLGVQLLTNRSLDEAATLRLVDELQRRPDVLHAQPNYIVRTTAVPNDTFYPFQWHYPAINLPDAWDITTGSTSVVVAVVDTGILHSAATPGLTHPDLVGKVLPGYDFISDPWVAGDGDGRDPDPYDVGDVPGGQSSYHGSHVAGTIAAATDNGIGVAGVDWNARILPIRVLGIGGGTLFDVVEGTLWAAGHPIAGVPSNPNPAHVINLSLGGTYTCTAFEQQAFDWIAASSPRRAIVVVAAGNANINAAQSSPASCGNVITVGATDARDARAPYSNYGTRIDVMAPGGDLSVDETGDGFGDGVLSLGRDDATATFDYWFQQGTSMAAPHVAGVASLMKALDPDIGQAAVLSALQATARPLSAAACNRPSGAECGAGLIDAAAALALVRDGTVPTPGIGDLVIEPGAVAFGATAASLGITLRNVGASPLTWSSTQVDASPLNPGAMPNGTVQVSATAGTIAAGGSQAISLTVDRGLVAVDGHYAFTVVFDVDGEASPALLQGTFVKAASAAPSLGGPLIVAAFVETASGTLELSGITVSDAFSSEFAFAALAGANLVIAWSDENRNGEVDAGDYLGTFPSFVQVTAGAVTAGVDITIDEIIDLGASTAPLPHGIGVDAWRDALEGLARPAAP